MAVSVVLAAFGKAVSQLADPRFRRVFFIGIFLALVLLIGDQLLLAGLYL